MDLNSIWMSGECDKGSFRVETIDRLGNCTGVVKGDFRVRNQQLSFTPDTPWVEGKVYRYILVSDDADEVCDLGEMCSAGDPALPLNTDPLNVDPGVLGEGIHGDIGGPPLEIQFIGRPPTRYVFAPLFLTPFVDTNGNGQVDQDEEPLDDNYFVMEKNDLHGLVEELTIGCTFKELDNCDPSKTKVYSNGSIFSEIKDYNPEYDAVLIDLHPTIVFGTSIKLQAKVLNGLLTIGMDTGTIIFRTRQVNGKPMPARFVPGGFNDDGTAKPSIFESEMDVYLDTPYLQVLGGLAGTSMHSLPLTLKLRGPVTFRDDGRLELVLSNTEDIEFSVDLYMLEKDALITFLGDNPTAQALNTVVDFFTFSRDHKVGTIDLITPKDSVKLHFVGESVQ